VKGRKVSQTVTPNRPSKRVELYWKSEIRIVKEFEKPFDDYEELCSQIINDKGVKAKDFINVRKEFRVLINKCWEIVQKFSPVISPRNKSLVSLSKDLRIDRTGTLTKQIVDSVYKRVIEDVDLFLERRVLPLFPCNIWGLSKDPLYRISMYPFYDNTSNEIYVTLSVRAEKGLRQEDLFELSNLWNINFTSRSMKAERAFQKARAADTSQ
jgi:hypothetical protein